MAVNTFTNAGNPALGTSASDIYTCPASTQAAVHGCFVANTSPSEITTNVQVVDSSNGQTYKVFCEVSIPGYSSVSMDKPLNLKAGDKVQAFSNTGSASSIFLSILEVA